jgi:hypothetical protein
MKSLMRWGGCAALLAVCLAGCGKKSLPKQSVVPARGTVTLGGKPVCLGYVELMPKTPGKGQPCNGVIGTDGTFALRTYSNGPEPDGAVPAEYKVSVSNYNPVTCGPKPPGTQPTKIPEGAGSGKTVEVKSGGGDVNIQLD